MPVFCLCLERRRTLAVLALPAWLLAAAAVPPLCTAWQARQVGRAWPPPLRYGVDVPQACRTRRGMLQPPGTLYHSPLSSRPRHAGCEGPRRGLRGCGGRPAHFPVPIRAVRALLVQPTHRATPSTRCEAAAPPCRAPSNMPQTAGDRQHSAPCNAHRRGTCGRCMCVCATHRQSHSSSDGEGCDCGHGHACARDLSVSVRMRMPACGLRVGRECSC